MDMTTPVNFDKRQSLNTLQLIGYQGFVQYHPELARRLGSFKAAIFLGHALYWSKHVNSKFRYRDGWFYLSAKQCKLATGLSTREQVTARELLIDHKLLQERKAGKPVTLNYRIDFDELLRFLEVAPVSQASPENPSPDSDSADSTSTEIATTNPAPGSQAKDFLTLVGASVTFYKPLADITGSVATGLYLSYVLQRFRQALERGKVQNTGAFHITQDSVRNALCLGIKTQRIARQRLKAAFFIYELTPYSLCVNMPAIASLLNGAAVPRPFLAKAKANEEASGVPDAVQGGQASEQKTTTPTKPSVGRRLFGPAALKQAELFGLDAQVEESTQMLVSAVQSNYGSRTGNLFRAKPRAAHTVPKCQTVAENAILEPHESSLPVQNAQNANDFADFANPKGQNRNCYRPKAQNINNNNTSKRTTTTTGAESSSKCDCTGPSCCCDLEISHSKAEKPLTAKVAPVPQIAIPSVLEERWHSEVKSVLANADPSVQQRLLDELEGRLKYGKTTIEHPPGYLQSLKALIESGRTVTLAYADRITAERVPASLETAVEQVVATEPYVPPKTYSANTVTGEKYKNVDFSSSEGRAKFFAEMGLRRQKGNL